MKTKHRLSRLFLYLLFLMPISQTVTPSNQISINPVKTKIIFFHFKNETPEYNAWLSTGIPYLIAHNLKQIPAFQILLSDDLEMRGERINFPPVITPENSGSICQLTGTDYVVYGAFSSTAQHDKDNALIKIRFSIASKDSPNLLSSQLSVLFSDITRLINAIAYTINEKTGSFINREFLNTPSIQSGEAFYLLMSGINSYKQGDYSDTLIKMRKAIITSGKYLDDGIRYISLSYVKLLAAAKKAGGSIRIKITSETGDKFFKLEYKELKKRYIDTMKRYARYSAPARYHLAEAYYNTGEFITAVNIWKRLLQTMDKGGSVLHWSKSFAARPSTAAIDTAAVYVGTQTGILFALNRFTGQTIWHSSVIHPIQVEPVIHRDDIAVVSGGYPSTLSRFFLFSKNNGNQTFSYVTAGEPAGTPAVIGDIVITGTATGSGELLAIDVVQKRIIWRRKSFFPRSITADGKNAFVLFRQYIKDGNEIKNAESVACIEPSSGKVIWVFSTERKNMLPDHNANMRHIGIFGDAVYFTSANRLFILDKSDGSLGKKVSFPELITFVYPTDELVYIGMAEKIIAYKPETGEIAFSFNSNGVITYPEIQNNTLLFGTSDRTLYAVNKNNGAYQFQFTAHGEIFTAPRSTKTAIYLSSYDGNLYCLEGGKHVFRYGTPKRKIYYSLGMALLKAGRPEEAAKYFSLM